MRNVRLICGDALDVLKTFAEASVHCCVTSPPYHLQRDYGCDGQLGMEPNPDCLGWATGNPCGECYLCKLLAVFQEIKRVLRHDGTIWINIGDSYWNLTLIRKKTEDMYLKKGDPGYEFYYAYGGGGVAGGTRRSTKHPVLKVKDLSLVPQRLALGLQAQGWYIRNYATWYKSNERVNYGKDRLGVRTETLIMAAKSKSYYFDTHALTTTDINKKCFPLVAGNHATYAVPYRPDDLFVLPTGESNGTNYAPMSKELVEAAILLSTSDYWACPTCGAPYRRVAERDKTLNNVIHTIEWRPGCEHPSEQALICTVPNVFEDTTVCTVLDPFSGSGTTGLVATSNNRDAILIDNVPAYIQESADRIYQDAPILNHIEVTG